MTILWVVTAIPYVFLCGLLYVMPLLSRRTQFFAVTVAASFRESAEARGVIRRYRLQLTIHVALGTIGYVLTATMHALNWLWLALIWPTAGALAAVAMAHREALRYAVAPSGVRVASLEARRPRLPGGPLVWAGPLLILVAAAAFTALNWSEIPARFPVHWGFDHQPNGWAERTLAGVFRPVLIGLLICMFVAGNGWMIVRNSRGSAGMRNLTARVLMAVAYLMATLFGWLTVALPFGRGEPSMANLGVLFGAIAAIIVVAVVFGMRVKADADVECDAGPAASSSQLGLDRPAGDNMADRDWIGGLVYFNSDDPALFVEKRIGIGYDLNFGNPRAWVLLGSILAIPAAIVAIAHL